MRTRAKQKHVASDRAWRENVPRHILFYAIGKFVDKFVFFISWKKKKIPVYYKDMN